METSFANCRASLFPLDFFEAREDADDFFLLEVFFAATSAAVFSATGTFDFFATDGDSPLFTADAFAPSPRDCAADDVLAFPLVVAGPVLGVRLRPTFAVLSLEALAACALLGVLLLRVFIVDEVLQAEILVQGGSW